MSSPCGYSVIMPLCAVFSGIQGGRMRRVKAGIYRSLVLMVMTSCLCVQAAERIVAIVGDTVITHHDMTALLLP